MTTKTNRTNSKKGPAAEYHVQKKNESFWVMTPDGKAIVVPHKTRHEAQMIANVFNHTKRDPLTVVTERKNRFTPRQTDTLIAALRLWQRAPRDDEKVLGLELSTRSPFVRRSAFIVDQLGDGLRKGGGGIRRGRPTYGVK